MARQRTWHWRQPRLGMLRQHPPAAVRLPRRQTHLVAPANPPSVAIVTPSYDQGDFIERTLRSVLDQRYPALRYAVQDGGSTDATATILDRYRDRLAACVSEPDGGQADAINRGFARIDGEIMAWLNSDDLLLPGALAAVARHFAANPDVDVVYGHRLLIDEHDRQIGCWVLPPHEDWPLELVDLVPQETLFWRRSIWDAAGGRVDPSFRFALDWDLLLRLCDAGARIERIPFVLGAFRIHDAQKTIADFSTGLGEAERIRAARHARPPSHDEAWRLVRPYLRRHVVHHTLHRAAMRIPGLYAEV